MLQDGPDSKELVLLQDGMGALEIAGRTVRTESKGMKKVWWDGRQGRTTGTWSVRRQAVLDFGPLQRTVFLPPLFFLPAGEL